MTESSPLKKALNASTYDWLRSKYKQWVNSKQPELVYDLRLAYARLTNTHIGGGPTFLGIGVQRCGTSTLNNLLNENPQVLMARFKELHYFDKFIHQGRTDKWYALRFNVWGDKKLEDIRSVGEITPCYIYYPGSIRRIHEYNPDLKLLVMLRNPVDRAFSNYKLGLAIGSFETLPFKEALDAEEERLKIGTRSMIVDSGYKARGRYVEQLDEVFSYFPREQVHIERLEDLNSDTQQTMNRIFDFLGVDSIEIKQDTHVNKLHKKALNDDFAQVRAELVEYFAPYNRLLTEKYGIKTDDWV
jgi:hypothetical protein